MNNPHFVVIKAVVVFVSVRRTSEDDGNVQWEILVKSSNYI